MINEEHDQEFEYVKWDNAKQFYDGSEAFNVLDQLNSGEAQFEVNA